MTSRFEARVELDAGPRTAAICESVRADAAGHPGAGARTSVRMEGGLMVVEVSSDRLPHLRAALGSALRLARACQASLEI